MRLEAEQVTKQYQTYPKKARPCGCGAVVARLLPKQETAGSNPVIRSIRKTKTMDLIQQ